MPIFKNPNEPRQPRPGVYGWFFNRSGEVRCLYIGQAGLPLSHSERCTLFRGISQLARATFCSQSDGKKLDTDFVVGTAIRYVEKTWGIECYWQHISDDPTEELASCAEWKPLIQDARGRIFTDLKCLSDAGEWNIVKKTGKTLDQRKDVVRQAESAVFTALGKYLV
jgi:hypothetical protein